MMVYNKTLLAPRLFIDLIGKQPMLFVFITVCQENTDISHFACCSIYAFYEWFKPIGRTVIHIHWAHISTYVYYGTDQVTYMY